MNVANLLETYIEKVGVQVSTVFEGREITNIEMRERANMLGNALKGLGVKDGEVVAVTMSNCPEVLQSFGGIFRIGATVLPILFLLPAHEMRYILEDSGAVTVITDFTQEEKVLEAAEGLDTIRHIIVVGAREKSRVLDFEELMQKASGSLTVVEKSADDIALLMYTSGTTGNPKGVLLSHENLIECGRSANLAYEFTKPINGLLCLPLAHIYGVGAMNTAYHNFFKGSTSVMVRWFDPEEVFRLIEKHGVNTFPAVPAMFAMLLYNPAADRYDMSSLEECVSGAAPLADEIRVGFTEKFGCVMRQLYGLTESSGIGALTPRDDPHHGGSAGKPYPNMELKVFDDEDNELPPGEHGEVVIRGPHVMKGYLNLPEETALALRGGWLHTGDIGYLDDEGFLFITDRKKDLIIKGGENIMPAQVEQVIYTHPAVAEAAVVGVRDKVYGEEIVAFVTLKPGVDAAPEDILEHCERNLMKFKRPREVVVLEGLPRTSVGKILKRELQRMYMEPEGE